MPDSGWVHIGSMVASPSIIDAFGRWRSSAFVVIVVVDDVGPDEFESQPTLTLSSDSLNAISKSRKTSVSLDSIKLKRLQGNVFSVWVG